MTTLQKKTRVDSVRQRRSSHPRAKPDSKKKTQSTRQAYRSGMVFLPVEPQPITRRTLHQPQGNAVRSHSGARQAQSRTSSRMTNMSSLRYVGRQMGSKNQQRHGYDFAFSLGRTAIHAPALSLPQLGPR